MNSNISRKKFPNLKQTNHLLEFQDPKERDIYSRLQDNLLEEYMRENYFRGFILDGNQGGFRFQLIELFLRLRQLSIHPEILINSLNRKFSNNNIFKI